MPLCAPRQERDGSKVSRTGSEMVRTDGSSGILHGVLICGKSGLQGKEYSV